MKLFKLEIFYLYLKKYRSFFSQQKLWRFMETNPEFRRPVKALNLDETRRRCYRQLNSLVENDILVKLYFILKRRENMFLLVEFEIFT